jgi:subtilisin family serine protease
VNYAIGTSWASAYVAGTAALIKQVNAKITPSEIQAILEQTGTPTYDPTDNIYVPAINVDKAVAMAEQLYGPNGTSTP